MLRDNSAEPGLESCQRYSLGDLEQVPFSLASFSPFMCKAGESRGKTTGVPAAVTKLSPRTRGFVHDGLPTDLKSRSLHSLQMEGVKDLAVVSDKRHDQ